MGKDREQCKRRKKWIIILDVAIVFSLIGILANLEIISSNNEVLRFILKQLMYVGCFVISICAINYNRIKRK